MVTPFLKINTCVNLALFNQELLLIWVKPPFRLLKEGPQHVKQFINLTLP